MREVLWCLMLKYIRNDDVAADTTLHEIKTFCEICDRYGVTPIHAITPIGRVRPISVTMDNATIRRVSGTDLFIENREVVEYLMDRKLDKFALHGLWHTHEPSFGELRAAAELILDAIGDRSLGWHVPPFNEGYGDMQGALLPLHARFRLELVGSLGAGWPRLEEFLEAGDPKSEIAYLHSHRFEHGPFTWYQLDRCLNRLTRQ